jgi:hypothetical protein
MQETRGLARTIVWTEDAERSLHELDQRHPELRSGLANILALLQRLADLGRLRSPEQFRSEGDGFYAIRHRTGLRAYGWWESNGRFVLSHFILKKKDALDESDRLRMQRNRVAFQPQQEQPP